MNDARGKKVFVGLSGGVDSSVSALRLKQQGFRVVGVFIKVWHPDFLICDWERERLDAMRVAAHLEIPFLTFDAEDVYKRDVADYMIAEYEAGRTPNPDVMCNKHVKFGVFLDFALEKGADYIATGHYAQIEKDEGGYHLLRGKDNNKDQTYFLWTLTTENLSKILFPIGNAPKNEVRKEAEEAGLPTARKHDSQGVCFLGKIDMKEFLSHYVNSQSGNVLDEKGNAIGQHDGALFYTLGQRHGFTLSSVDTHRTPYYVIAKDLKKNTLTVSPEASTIERSEIKLTGINQIQELKNYAEVTAQFRYRQKPFAVRLVSISDSDVTLEILEETETPSVGQSCVLYSGDECLGGGIIS